MGMLDEMTKGIKERKVEAAGPRLTPVGTEASPVKPSIPEVKEVFLTNEAVTDIAKDLRKQAQLLLNVAEGLDQLTGTVHELPDVVADAKAEERAADKKAAEREELGERMKRLTDEAQAAVYAAADAVTEEPVAPKQTVGWECPKHPNDEPIRLTSRKGRSYLACDQVGCTQFEKESA